MENPNFAGKQKNENHKIYNNKDFNPKIFKGGGELSKKFKEYDKPNPTKYVTKQG